MFRLDTCYTVPWDDPSSSGRHNLESRRRLMKRVLLVVPAVLVVVACEDTQQPTMSVEPRTAARAAAAARSLSSTNPPLLRRDGNSEQEIAIGGNGTMAMVGLSWGLAADKQLGTSLWTGPFGATPTFQGIIDAALQQPGRVEFGGEDGDVDFGSTGTLHLTTLLFLGTPTLVTGHLGVSAIPCRNPTPSFSAAGCRAQIFDLT